MTTPATVGTAYPTASAAVAPIVNPGLATSPVTLEKLHEIQNAARLELARRYAKKKDILNWGRIIFPEKFTLPFCRELHDYFVEVRKEERTSTEAPRNHAKTAIRCFLIPLFQALEEPNSFRHYLNVQATGLKAYSVNLSIKSEVEGNPFLRALYGNQVGLEKWTDGQFVLRNGVVFTAVGAGQSIRGLNYRSMRPDFIIVDDLYDEDDINRPDATGNKNNWFWGSLYPARAKSRRCSVHVQGTAINKEDLLEELKSKPRWVSRTFAAVDFDKKTALWSELNSFESLMADMKDMPITIFMREMQNERRDDATSIIKHEWLQDWEVDLTNLKFDGNFLFQAGILGIDPSIGKKTDSDATGYAFVLRGQRSDGTLPLYYIESLANEHLSFQARLDRAKLFTTDRTRERPCTQVFVEGISGFADFGDRVAASVSVPCTVVDHVKDKITTLEKKSHFFQNRRIFLNKNIDPEMKKTLVHQLTTNFPKHDDLRDALLLCLEDESTNWASWMNG